MNAWGVILVCGAATYLTRVSFIALFGKREIPVWIRKALRYVPAAVLSVIACQNLFYPADRLDISLSNTRLLAGMVASVVAWSTKNALLTILVGMLAWIVLNLVHLS